MRCQGMKIISTCRRHAVLLRKPDARALKEPTHLSLPLLAKLELRLAPVGPEGTTPTHTCAGRPQRHKAAA
jgi:hypothetical protein